MEERLLTFACDIEIEFGAMNGANDTAREAGYFDEGVIDDVVGRVREPSDREEFPLSHG